MIQSYKITLASSAYGHHTHSQSSTARVAIAHGIAANILGSVLRSSYFDTPASGPSLGGVRTRRVGVLWFFRVGIPQGPMPVSPIGGVVRTSMPWKDRRTHRQCWRALGIHQRFAGRYN